MKLMLTAPGSRGVHSSTSQLNLSRFCHGHAIEHPAYPTRVQQQALMLSRNVDECKPLPGTKRLKLKCDEQLSSFAFTIACGVTSRSCG